MTTLDYYECLKCGSLIPNEDKLVHADTGTVIQYDSICCSKCAKSIKSVSSEVSTSPTLPYRQFLSKWEELCGKYMVRAFRSWPMEAQEEFRLELAELAAKHLLNSADDFAVRNVLICFQKFGFVATKDAIAELIQSEPMENRLKFFQARARKFNAAPPSRRSGDYRTGS